MDKLNYKKKDFKDLKLKRQVNLLKCYLNTFYIHNHKINNHKTFMIVKINEFNNKVPISYKVPNDKVYNFIYIRLKNDIKTLGVEVINNFINDFLKNKIQLNQFK